MRMVKDYRVVGLPLGGSGCGLHDFYLKVHRDNKTATDRTLFVGNVDYGLKRSVEEIGFYLRHLFEVFGDVEGVSVSEFKSSFSTTSSNETGIEGSSEESFDLRARFAHILFCKRASLKAALKSDDVIYFDRAEALLKGDLSSHFNPPSQKTALRLICEKLRWVDCNPEELKHEVDEYMLRFEEMEDMERKTLEKKAKQADEEGFVLVTSKKKRKRVDSGKSSNQKRIRNKKGKEKELKNFYRFQMREDKQSKLVELRKKFEEDKARVAKMKANRSFKPF